MADLIIVVDTQADFMLPDGALPVRHADEIVAPLQAWLEARSAADSAAVLFTFDTHFADSYPGSAEAELFPIHCVRDTPGWRNLIDFTRLADDLPCATLEKGVFDMWAEPDVAIRDARRDDAPATPRDRWFADLRARGIDHAIVVGVAADYCVAQAVAGLVARGFRVTVLRGLTRGIARSIDAVVRDDFANAPVTLATGN